MLSALGDEVMECKGSHAFQGLRVLGGSFPHELVDGASREFGVRFDQRFLPVDRAALDGTGMDVLVQRELEVCLRGVSVVKGSGEAFFTL